MNKFKFGDKVSYRSCKNAFYLQETDDIRSLIAVELAPKALEMIKHRLPE